MTESTGRTVLEQEKEIAPKPIVEVGRVGHPFGPQLEASMHDKALYTGMPNMQIPNCIGLLHQYCPSIEGTTS